MKFPKGDSSRSILGPKPPTAPLHQLSHAESGHDLRETDHIANYIFAQQKSNGCFNANVLPLLPLRPPSAHISSPKRSENHIPLRPTSHPHSNLPKRPQIPTKRCSCFPETKESADYLPTTRSQKSHPILPRRCHAVCPHFPPQSYPCRQDLNHSDHFQVPKSIRSRPLPSFIQIRTAHSPPHPQERRRSPQSPAPSSPSQDRSKDLRYLPG